MSKEKWIEDLRRSVQGHATTPPEDLWKGISAGLSGATQQAAPKRQPVNPRWAWMEIAAAFALLIGIGVLWMHRPSEETMAPIIITATNKTETNQSTSIPSPIEEVADASTPSIKANRPINTGKGKKNYSQSQHQPELIPDTKDIPDNTLKKENAQKPEPEVTLIPAQNTEKGNDPSSRTEAYRSQNTERPMTSHVASRKSTNRRVQISISGSGVTTEKTSFDSDKLLYSSLQEKGDKDLRAYKGATTSIDELLTETVTKRHHQQPLSLGIHIKGEILGRLCIESGIMYHRLYSTFESPVHSSGPRGNQTLEYIGLPLGFSYSVWEKGRLSVFASIGGQLGINIKRTVEIDNIEDVYMLDMHNRLSHTMDKPQWSLNAGIGIQYNILSRIGLYVQPEVSYYLDNGSPVETLYKTTPLNIGVNAGIRVDLGALHTRR